ncbi:phosphotransferase [Jiangella alba]|uniref:phosphotransferase n=1 Tax=Jiangella alba TaxID=561176 RepID=UPI00083EBC31|nr:phosphotransferase [Jiangella alba]
MVSVRWPLALVGGGQLPGSLVAELLATRPAGEDFVVCHGDLATQNVLIDPETLTASGVLLR